MASIFSKPSKNKTRGGYMPLTQTDIEAANDVTLAGFTTVQGSEIAAPSPLDVESVSVSAAAASKTVSAPSVASQNAGAVQTVSYTQVTTADEINTTTLNKTAETLKDSVNTALTNLYSAINAALTGVSGDTSTAITALVSDVNSKLAALKGESDTLTSDVNSQLSSIVADMNVALGEIRVKNLEQSNNAAAKINLIASEANAQDLALKGAIDELTLRVTSLDDVYGTDSDIATKITNINNLISTLRESDIDFVAAVSGVVSEVNLMERLKTKQILVSTATGIFNVNLVSEGFPEAILPEDYNVSLEVIDNTRVGANIINKDQNGFDIKLESKGVHFVPQPHDASVTPVKVIVRVSNMKRDPMTFNIDTLNSSFVTSGAGTDSNTIPTV